MPEGENNLDALYNIDTLTEDEEKTETPEEDLEDGDLSIDEEEDSVDAAFNDNIPEE